MTSALITGLVGVAAAGCGATSQTSTTGRLVLKAYLVRDNEETGLHATGAPATSATPAQWTAPIPNSDAEKKRLVTEGFHGAVSVQTGSVNGNGVSWVMELGSASDAAREQTAELRSFTHVGGPATRFTIPNVSGADGFAYPGTNPQDANALFREGRCVLLVGDQESATNYRAPVIAAVQAIWARTHTHKGACTV